MSKNKTGQYVKYAFGEIILVVIGILIALQINNWNENRIQQIRVKGYMKNLAEDISSDINEINNNIQYYEKDIEGGEFIIKSDQYKSLEADSIIKLASSIYLIDKMTTQTYEKIKNEGLIESLGSEKINNLVNDYYNIYLPYYKELLVWDKEYTNTGLNFWLYNKNYESSSVRYYNTNTLPFLMSAQQRKTDLISLIESIEGRNHIRGNLDRKKHCLKRVNELKVVAQNLINLLNIELNNK